MIDRVQLEDRLAEGATACEAIKGHFRSSIEKRSVLPGQRLASVRELARSLDVSSATVAKAMRELQLEGYLETRPGKGVYVHTSPPGCAQLSVNWLSNMTAQEKSGVTERFRQAEPQCELVVSNEPSDIVPLSFEMLGKHADEYQDIGEGVLRLYGRQESGGEAFDPLRQNGILSVLPVTFTSHAVAINVDLFEAAGVPVPPADWDEQMMLDLAKRLTKPGQGKYGCVACKDARPFVTFLWQNGGQLFDSTGTRSLLAEPEAVAAGRYIRDLAMVSPPTRDGVVPRMSEGFREFLTGRVGMAFVDSDYYRRLRTNPGFRWAVLPMPARRQRTAMIWGNGFAVRADVSMSPRVRAFLKIAAGIEKWPDHAAAASAIPLHKDLESPDTASSVFADARNHGRFYLSDVSPSYRTKAMLDTMGVVTSSIKYLLRSDTPVEQVLAHLREIVNDMIHEHGHGSPY